jgi:hypothetical protein
LMPWTALLLIMFIVAALGASLPGIRLHIVPCKWEPRGHRRGFQGETLSRCTGGHPLTGWQRAPSPTTFSPTADADTSSRRLGISPEESYKVGPRLVCIDVSSRHEIVDQGE